MAIDNTKFNSPALYGLFNYNRTANALAVSIERLSTGRRVNAASDDPSAQTRASQFSYQIQGFRSSTSNAEQAASMVETAFGALTEMKDVLAGMRNVATRASELTWGGTTDEYNAMNAAFAELRSKLGRMASDAQFGGVSLLDGSLAAFFQVGPESSSGNQLAVAVPAMTLSYIAGGDSLMIAAGLTTPARADSALAVISLSYQRVNDVQAAMGFMGARIHSIINDLQNSESNTSAARSKITDADMASEVALFTRNQIVSQTGSSVVAQANSNIQNVVSLLNKL